MATKAQLFELKDQGESVPTTKEVAELVATIISAVKQAQDALQSLVDNQSTAMTEQQQSAMASIELKARQLEQAFTEYKDEMTKSMGTLQGLVKTSIEEVRGEIPELPPEVDLSDIYNSFKELEAKIPKIPEEMKAEIIRNKLESLEGDERLDKSAIKGLEEIVSRLEKGIASRPSSLGMRKVPIIKRIDLTSQVDGVVTSFTLPRDTVEVLGLWSTQFPITFNSSDWSLSGNTLTINSSIPVIQSGQTLMVIIETLFYG